MTIKELRAADFDHTLETSALLVIDFWAEWCGPCKAFSRVMSEVASEYSDVVFTKVNVEQEKSLAEEFAVRSIPFVMIVKERTVIYAESGALSAAALRDLLNQARKLG